MFHGKAVEEESLKIGSGHKFPSGKSQQFVHCRTEERVSLTYFVHLFESSLDFLLGHFDGVPVFMVVRGDFVQSGQQQRILGHSLHGHLQRHIPVIQPQHYSLPSEDRPRRPPKPRQQQPRRCVAALKTCYKEEPSKGNRLTKERDRAFSIESVIPVQRACKT